MDKTISYYVKDFKSRMNPFSLLMAVYLIFKEGRFIELLYGFYGFLIYRPSKLYADEGNINYFETHIQSKLNETYNPFEGLIFPDYLKHKYGELYKIDLLPEGVRFRLPSILAGNHWLVLGEYGDASGKLFFYKNQSFQTIESYNMIKGFRHIHCIHPKNESELFICTGDDKKFLDLWSIEGDCLKFKERLMKRFAGFTAAVKIGKEHYFGSDFSQRPNYIWRFSDRKKFFFPEPCYTMFVMYFEVLNDRYLISYHMHTSNFGGKSVSVFDTQKDQFVFASRIES